MTKEKIVQRSISDFLNKEYKNYALSVIEERAIPSFVDGFKPTARNVMHGSLAGDLKSGKLQKLLVLTGDTFKHSLYAHGDASLAGVATGLAQDFNDGLTCVCDDYTVTTKNMYIIDKEGNKMFDVNKYQFVLLLWEGVYSWL